MQHNLFKEDLGPAPCCIWNFSLVVNAINTGQEDAADILHSDAPAAATDVAQQGVCAYSASTSSILCIEIEGRGRNLANKCTAHPNKTPGEVEEKYKVFSPYIE
jgi:hypothetical protein